MKLLKIINRKYALFSIILLICGTVLIYFFLRYFINREIVEKLESTKQNVIASLDRGKIVEFYPVVEIKELNINYNLHNTENVKDTSIYNPVEQGPDSYKQLSFLYTRGDRKYQVFVRTDNIDASDIMIPLGLPLFVLILSVLLIFNLIVNRINFKIWKPFYKNLDILKNFSASDKNELMFSKSGIDEFEDLNNSLIGLTNRIRNDYGQLKEFSENASHELQTPLSIIRVKIESMLQNEKLESKYLDRLQSIYKMINRLTRLNRSLTLLSRIESPEYEKKEEICVAEFISKKLDEFSEIAEAKQIEIKTKLDSGKKLFINPDLFEILLSNLISNAVKYNIEGGSMEIDLSENELVIKNTGVPTPKSPEKMFDRFEKGDQSEESSGLGLTIVKQICTMNRFDVKYTFENSNHVIRIKFPG